MIVLKKVIVLSTVVCLLMGIGQICVFADDGLEAFKVMPYNLYSTRTSVGLSINASGTAAATAKSTGIPGITTKMTCKMSIQKKTGGSWATIKKWSSTTKGTVLNMSEKKNVEKGVYRVHAVFRANAGKKKEKLSMNSKIVEY